MCFLLFIVFYCMSVYYFYVVAAFCQLPNKRIGLRYVMLLFVQNW